MIGLKKEEHMQEQMVSLGEVRLWTIEQGEGLPVMLCNGGPGCCDYLGPVAEMIDDLVQVHRWEQRGCGRSEAVPPYDHATCLQDLESLRRHFGFERWIIGGHSWGANLALDYAVTYPERVLALIYLAGTGIKEDWKPEFKRAQQERSEPLPDFAYPANMEVNEEGSRSRLEFLHNADLVERVRALDVPALLIQGERDLRPNWSSEQLAHLLPKACYHVIQDAEHCLWLTHPQQLRELLRIFLHNTLAVDGHE
jgi:proline iminopeptidase